MERDPKTGRFLPGNKIAVGNRGNCKPKWGNKNALKHGFFQNMTCYEFLNDGRLKLFNRYGNHVIISRPGYMIDEEGCVRIHDAFIPKLRELGFVF
ncbi:hypothetical protein M4A92_15660 [Caldibacillus thermoamylovorans]|uniref:hypothetical protein n=1 Tax=Caldibacillus thermoamylovorans TaxID=35841 RepID=UPI00203D3FF7|nr:hypothetical protein [Caldibacillus thermoamylovorans]MCM3800031.1 hypothetical protein [Caldibacillus thermoamylovorans]